MNAYEISAAAIGAAGIYDLTRGHKKWGWVALGAVPVLLYLGSEHRKKIEAEQKRMYVEPPPPLEAEFEEIHREQYRGYTIVLFGRGAIVWEVRDGTNVVAQGSVGPSDEDLSEDIAQAIAEARAYVDALEGT